MRRLVIALLFVLVGCDGSPQAPPAGTWRAVATLPGGELPFRVELQRGADGGLAATVVNGSEEVAVPEVAWRDGELRMTFPAFNSAISLAARGDALEGTLTLVKRGGVRQTIPLRLEHGGPHRFFAGEQDVNADFGGRWRVAFTDADGAVTSAVGEFTQRNGVVDGTFRTPTGDYRYLSGQVRDRTLYLSTFDGAHAFLFIARQAPDGTVSGDFWSGSQWHERWTAQRDAGAALPDPNTMSKMKDDAERVTFAFPDTSGRVVRHDDPRFAGKVLIVALAGSWCPNCHDEAAFLAPLHAGRQARGLEVVGLMFEHLPDFEEAAMQVERFREKFDIGYPLLVAGYSDKADATESLGLLDRVIAYPTMIVVDRSGTVRRVHTGFNGPGTGVHYEEFREEFTSFIDRLLAEGES